MMAKLNVVQGIMKVSIFRLLTSISVLLLTIISGCGQSAPANPLLTHSEKAAMREVREIAENVASLLNVYMDARITEMLLCSKLGGPVRDALIKSEARTDANRILEEWLKISGGYEAILLLDRKGVCIASAPSSLVNQDLSNHKAFQGALEGKLEVTDAHKSEILITLDPKSRGWTIVIAAPLKAGDHIAGVLMSCLNWSKLWELMTSTRVGTPLVQTSSSVQVEVSTGYVYVLNEKNQTIIHPSKNYGVSLRDPQINLPDLDDAIKKKVINSSYKALSPRTGRIEKRLAGFAYPKGYGNFSGLGWVVGVNASEDQLIGAPWWMQLFR